MRKTLFVSLAAVCALLVSSSLSLAAENWIGTWKLNGEKSKYNPGPGPKRQVLKFEGSSLGGIRVVSEGENAEGQPTRSEYTSTFDGKDVAWKGNPNADTAGPRKLDDNSYENTWKKDGKVRMTSRARVSADGKTLTISSTGKDVQNRDVDNTAVYEKQ
jgi:hypothetical protein